MRLIRRLLCRIGWHSVDPLSFHVYRCRWCHKIYNFERFCG